jgi:SpoVK/Ycf46/Vps4 family AAA+-type ATPase
MNSLFGSIQSSLTDTVRISLLHSITSNGKTNHIYDTFTMLLLFSVLTFIYNSFLECHFSYKSIYDKIKSCFYRKYSIKLTGKTTTSTGTYSAKSAITAMYSDDFKAIWYFIMNNICKNMSIYELREIKNVIKIRTEDDYIQHTTGLYIVSQKDHFVLDKELGIYAFTIDKNEDTNDKLIVKTEIYEITIYSYKNNTSVLKQYIQKQVERYLSELKESRSNKRFMYSLTNTDYSGRDTSSCWREDLFHSSKTFQNIFFENKDAILDKLNFFIHNREWYDTHGIPYTLGIGLYGPPGTGKTSFIKALANYLGDRHLVNMPMIRIQTKKQLNDFYYETRYSELNIIGSVGFMQKIIVFEDIDCAGDIVLERNPKKDDIKQTQSDENIDFTEIKLSDKLNHMDEEIKNTIRENIANESRKFMTKLTIPQEERITLDDILNLWDGIHETPGRVLIISSNHYDKLDAAIRRPGRIDITIELKNASRGVISDMYSHFYDKPISTDILSTITPELYSPAEIVNLYTMYRNDESGFLKRLCENQKLKII